MEFVYISYIFTHQSAIPLALTSPKALECMGQGMCGELDYSPNSPQRDHVVICDVLSAIGFTQALEMSSATFIKLTFWMVYQNPPYKN